MTSDRGAGSVLIVAVVAAVVLAFALVAPLGLVLAARQRAAGAADAAALAGADTAAGLALGVPCRVAADTAEASGGRATRCRQRGDLVRVAVAVPVLGLAVTAEAVAGPPR